LLQAPLTISKTFFFIALPCEAKPFIDYYKLKKQLSISAFNLFQHEDICLTVTGVGKNAMAAGVAYTLALNPGSRNPILMNIGITGHRQLPVGSVLLTHKITDADSGRRFYPPLVFKSALPTANLITVAKAQTNYPDNSLYDMEASAFYETSIRFSTGELVQSVKIISDNLANPVVNINPALVTKLIQDKLADIVNLIEQLNKVAEQIDFPNLLTRYPIPDHFRLSESEKHQLTRLLTRWLVLCPDQTIEPLTCQAKSGKDLLNLIRLELNKTDIGC
jgi:hypothetical protein